LPCSSSLKDSLTLPVVAGLAVGIAFVLLFAFSSYVFRDIIIGTTESGGIKISLLGMKNRYSMIEPLNFTVTANGYGIICGFEPNAKIFDALSGKLVYEVPTLHLAYLCLPEPKDVNVTAPLYEFMYPSAPVVIGESGHYRLVVEVEGVMLQKDFVVYELPPEDIEAVVFFHNRLFCSVEPSISLPSCQESRLYPEMV
jgi:hypothetical protein